MWQDAIEKYKIKAGYNKAVVKRCEVVRLRLKSGQVGTGPTRPVSTLLHNGEIHVKTGNLEN